MNRGFSCRTLICVTLAALALAAPAAAQGLVRMYELTVLDIDGAGATRAYAINNTSQVIGWADNGDKHHAAHWHNQAGTDLHGTVHFELMHPLFDQDHAEAYDISDADQVVGTARTMIKCQDVQFVVTHSFVLRPAVLTDLATPYPGDALANLRTFGDPCKTAYDSTATGISGRNHVCGWADREDGVIRAFLVTPRQGAFFRDANGDGVNDIMTDLGTLGASDPVSSATAVNDVGEVTGYSYTITSKGVAAYRGFLVTPNDTDQDGVGDEWFVAGGGSVNALMNDIGTLGGLNSWGRDINNAAQIVGESDINTPTGQYTHGFVWYQGSMTDLGTLRSGGQDGFSAASGINERGAIVGWAENDNRQRRAFLHEAGKMYDLNDLLFLLDGDGNVRSAPIVLTEARDINEDGVIVGWGTLKGGTASDTRGFILNPVLVDPKVFEQIQEETGGTGGTGSGGTGSGSTTAPIFGLPSHLQSNTTTDPNNTTGGDALAPGGLCGFSAATSAPLALMGLGLIRWTRRR